MGKIYSQIAAVRIGFQVILGLGIALAQSGVTAQVSTTLSGGGVTAIVGVSGQSNGQNVAGRFGVLDAQNNNAVLMTEAASAIAQSYVTVHIDGGIPLGTTDPTKQTVPGWDFAFGDVGELGKTGEAAWIQPPIVFGNQIIASWATTPGATVVPVPIPTIQVDLVLTIVHDMVQYKFTITNLDNQAHTVGLRFAQDYQSAAGTVAPIITSQGGQFSTETDLLGASVPSSWLVGTFTAGTVGGVTAPLTSLASSPTRADRLIFAALSRVTPNPWAVQALSGLNLATTGVPAAAALFYNSATLSPSQTRTVTTLFGKNGSDADYGFPWAAGLSGPPVEKYDPTQPPGMQFTPNPIPITAFVHNLSTTTLTNVTVVLSLPAGLAFAAGETATKRTTSIGLDSEATFTWQVVPTGTSSGKLYYSAAFAAGPGIQGKSVTRAIEIPALPVHGFVQGLQMVSFPFTFDDPRPSVVFGLDSLSFQMLNWDTKNGIYAVVQQIIPGQGYWLQLNSAQTINLNGAHPVDTGGTPASITLIPGWNQIGTPFGISSDWANVQVINTDPTDPNYLQTVSIQLASDAAHQWVLPTLYRYDTSSQQYAFDTTFDSALTPFVGYWVKCLKPGITLIITPAVGRAAVRASGSRAMASAVAGGWKVRLEATDGKSSDTWNFFGASPQASDGYDAADVEKPPMMSGHTTLGFDHSNWSVTRAGLYAQDIQSGGAGQRAWHAVVTSAKAGSNITLSWPDIAKAPRGYEFYVKDDATGAVHSMRGSSSITVNTGSTGSRAITITAVPRSSGALRVSGLAIRSVGRGTSAAITYGISTPATVSVEILGANGATVRNLMSRAASVTTGASVVWDQRDARGVSVPAGVYTVRVKAVSDDGQAVTAVTPYVLTR